MTLRFKEEIEKAEKTGEYYVRQGPFWPHRLRFERASFLVSERGYETYDLMAFFGWLDSTTPTNYVKESGKELLAKNLLARSDNLRQEKARLQEAERSQPSDAPPKYLTE
ncbi:MAG: hypothetical protein NTY03_01305 [Candidatus Bathyarchaeota archaeon]|nr:hypothetical protein [Candidatus Bathyarchaeota archaeon]